MRVGGDDVDVARAHERQPARPLGLAVRAGQRRRVDLQPRARRALGGDRLRPLHQRRAALGMADERPEALRPDPGRRGQELVDARGEERRLDQHPARVARPLRDHVERPRVEGRHVVVRQLGARPHRERHAGGVERVLDLAHARGNLAEDALRHQVAHVRRDRHEPRPVGHGEPGEADRVVEVGRAVVDLGQKVEVQLGARHPPLYRDTRPARHRAGVTGQ